MTDLDTIWPTLTHLERTLWTLLRSASGWDDAQIALRTFSAPDRATETANGHPSYTRDIPVDSQPVAELPGQTDIETYLNEANVSQRTEQS